MLGEWNWEIFITQMKKKTVIKKTKTKCEWKINCNGCSGTGAEFEMERERKKNKKKETIIDHWWLEFGAHIFSLCRGC